MVFIFLSLCMQGFLAVRSYVQGVCFSGNLMADIKFFV